MLVFPLGVLGAAGLAVLLGRTTLAVGLVATLLLVTLLLAWETFQRRARRPGSGRSSFVYIEPDGRARELTPEERTYLATPFQGGDGAAPYVKPWYRHRNPRGDLGGYLPRFQVPPWVRIHAPEEPDRG